MQWQHRRTIMLASALRHMSPYTESQPRHGRPAFDAPFMLSM